jgi:chromosome segregation ATPase
MEISDAAGMVSAGVAAFVAIMGTVTALNRRIETKTDATRLLVDTKITETATYQDAARERLRLEMHDRFSGLEAQASRLSTTSAQRDEVNAGDRQIAVLVERLSDRVERISDRLGELSGVQAAVRLNTEMLRDLVSLVGRTGTGLPGLGGRASDPRDAGD